MRLRNLALAGAALVMSIGLGAPSLASASNLIVNGSFETGDLTGWTDSYGVLNPFGTTYGSGMDGTYWAWLAGYETDITLSQTVNGLTPGHTYDLSFITASEAYNSDQLRVSINGGPGTIFSAPPYNPGGGPNGGFWDVWVSHSLSFVAPASGSATITFDTNGLNAGGYDVGLDNVVLVGVPEPATWALMLGGVGMIGAGLRMNRRKAMTTVLG